MLNFAFNTHSSPKSTKSGIIVTERRQTTMTGTIKVKTDRGFGFISRDGETKDLFFHSKDLVGVTFDALQVGAKVEFDVVDGEKGPSAKNVKIVA